MGVMNGSNTDIECLHCKCIAVEGKQCSDCHKIFCDMCLKKLLKNVSEHCCRQIINFLVANKSRSKA